MKKIILILTAIVFSIQAVPQTISAQQKNSTASGDIEFIIEELIDCYIESLNEPNDKKRLEIVEKVWQKDGIFAYPGSEVQGFSAIGADILKVQKKYPNAIVRRTSDLEIVENKYVRFNWEFGIPKAEPLIKGHDFAVLADGKLRLVVGYFDYVSEKAK
jgi:hypothetical protein